MKKSNPIIWFIVIAGLSFFLITHLNGQAFADENGCVIEGFFNCVDKQEVKENGASDSLRPERAACNEYRKCIRLENGKCGWKETPDFQVCDAGYDAIEKRICITNNLSCLIKAHAAVQTCTNQWNSSKNYDEFSKCIKAIEPH